MDIEVYVVVKGYKYLKLQYVEYNNRKYSQSYVWGYLFGKKNVIELDIQKNCRQKKMIIKKIVVGKVYGVIEQFIYQNLVIV